MYTIIEKGLDMDTSKIVFALLVLYILADVVKTYFF